MGKIRVKSFNEAEEDAKSKRLEERRAAKKEAKKAEKEEKSKNTEAFAPEELAAMDAKKETKEETKEETAESKKEKKAYNDKNKKANPRSKKYNSLLDGLEKSKLYGLSDALELLEKLQRKSFDETVELHVNTVTAGISGNVTLPHGTGKKTKVAVADDKLIGEIEKGIISFDMLVAEPQFMPKLARIAKVLGPRGLMPNPKNGTISSNPQEVIKKYEGGLVNFKTEKAPIIHLTVGKMSFGPTKLSENAQALLNAIKKQNISSVTIKSTMSPGIKVRV